MTKEQRRNHMQKVGTTQLVCTDGITADSEHLSTSALSAVQLSIQSEEFHCGVKIPPTAIQAIWKRAAEPLSDPNAISPAPGYNTKCKMVTSQSGNTHILLNVLNKGNIHATTIVQIGSR